MTKLDKDKLRDDLYHAIKKAMDNARNDGSMDILTTESVEIIMADSCMNILTAYEDAQDQWEDNGYLKV